MAQPSMSPANQLWTMAIQNELTEPLGTNPSRDLLCNVNFVCRKGETLKWNGLSYLASISGLFQARSGEEQNFTVHLPDYNKESVKKLLLLITTGEAFVKKDDVMILSGLARDLGVRLL